MRDEGLSLAYNVLNVPRLADPEEVEAAFARLYKAARRRTDGADQRRQELNGALAVLRDAEQRALEVVEAYWVPLDSAAVVPSADTLAAELLPLELVSRGGVDEHVLLPRPATVVDEVMRHVEAPVRPDARTILRQLAARSTLDQLDPWEETGA